MSPRPICQPQEVHLLLLDENAEAAEFWEAGYPGMRTTAGNRKAIDEAGYTPVADFVLPVESWWTDYYEPLEARLEHLRDTYAGDEEAIDLLDAARAEIELFRRHSDSYGYVFYVARRD